jgi:RNA polymerase sigma-70 factor (ECF subfamily)
MDEQQLVRDCIKGRKRAQKAFYERFAPKMYAVCLRYAKDESLAKDFLQESFIRIFAHLKDFRFEGALEGWIRRIVVNVALENL